MQKEDIEYNLSLLGKQLEELGLRRTIRLLMIGGGFMLTQIGNRLTTDDVDVQVQNIADPLNSDDYLIFKNAVRFVAYDLGIAEDWLSDNIGDFLTMAGVRSVPKGKLWRRFQKLEIYVPPTDFILAHKLVAGRSKDFDDIGALLETLRIRSRKQAQRVLDRYIDQGIQESHNVQSTLERFFS